MQIFFPETQNNSTCNIACVEIASALKRKRLALTQKRVPVVVREKDAIKREENLRIDEFLPQYDFTEVHKVTVKASTQATFEAVKRLLPSDLSPLVFIMLNLRELPAILTGKASSLKVGEKPFLSQLYEEGFIPLDETNDEIVFGLVGQFWKLTGGEEHSGVTDVQGFQAFDRTGFAKVAANLYVQPLGEQSRLSTETRIWAPDPQTRKKFAFYWRLISFGSGWIRVMWLKAIKRRAEHDET